jgi:glycosyltransferase involved in cell wall biosynthesis
MSKRKTKSNFPKISVIIPSYNKVNFIDQTLESIFNQKYPNLEVIIQDGGSTDGTLEVIKKYAKKYKKILSYVSRKDKGQADAINKGLKKAKGDIITYLNADDLYEKDTFKIVSNTYKKYPNALWFAGEGIVVNDQNIEVASYVSLYKKALLSANSYQFLLIVNYLYQPSVFLTKKAVQMVKKFANIKGIVMEYDAWLKLGKTQMPVIVTKNLSRFRMSDTNLSTTSFDKTLSSDLKIVKKYTSNNLILFLHKIHNDLRKRIVNII